MVIDDANIESLLDLMEKGRRPKIKHNRIRTMD